MPKTKEKILIAALQLFNQNGLSSTPLQSIADEVKISVGNLAYHYRNKQDIIAAHSMELNEKLVEALAQYRNYPNFLDLHIQLEQTFDALEQYRYIFTNLGEMSLVYPDAYEVVLTFYNKLLTQLETRLDYHRNRKRMQFYNEEQIPLLAANLADAIVFSPLRNLLKPELNKPHLHLCIWKMIEPYLSESGLQEWNMLISPTILK